MLQGSEYARVLNISGSWICLWFWIFQGPEYASGSEYFRVLNKPGFWISQGSEYASGSEYARVLNKSGLRINQGSQYTKVLNMPLVLNLPGFWICQGYTGFWICLIMSDWICLDLSEYVATCANMPKSAWMAFVLYFPIGIHCLLERVVIYFNVYTKLEVLVWRKMTLYCWRHTILFNSCMNFIWFLF